MPAIRINNCVEFSAGIDVEVGINPPPVTVLNIRAILWITLLLPNKYSKTTKGSLAL